jgi:hypothetical protein
MRGVTLRTSGTRGHLVSEKEEIPISNGHFYITTRRLIFSGDKKSFECPLKNVLDVTNFPEGIWITETRREQVRNVHFPNENGEIVAEILTVLFSRNP